MPTVGVAGADLYYEVTGDAGPWLAFLHGGGGNHLSWWQQVPHFSRSYRCLTLDMRAYGLSTGEPAADLDRNADDLIALLDHLGVPRTFLVCQSIGGAAAFGLAVRQPQRVGGLVMADTDLGVPVLEVWRHRVDRLEQGRRSGGLWARSFPEREPAKAFLYQQIGALNARPGERAGQRSLAVLEPVPVDLASFRVPTLFLCGSEDTLCPPEACRNAVAHVPGSRYVEVPRAGHSAYFEQPEIFNREVEAFLEGCAAP